MTTAPRYRLGLTEPLFALPPPDPVKSRGLTEAELDRLAGDLRKVTKALRRYDAATGNCLVQLEELEDPWWQELRPELLRRSGFDPQTIDLDESVGCASGLDFYYQVGVIDHRYPKPYQRPRPGWVDPLLADIAARTDTAPLAAAIAENTRALAAVDLGKLDGAIGVLRVFHPFGGPHQVEITNLAELWGMHPVAVKDGSPVYGYGEKGPAARGDMPWQSGTVKPIVDIKPADGPPEALWLPVYEGLIGWIAELLVVLSDRLGAIRAARETVEHLQHQAKFLAPRVREHAGLAGLCHSLGLCGPRSASEPNPVMLRADAEKWLVKGDECEDAAVEQDS
jgi:hypothetical protein